MKFVLEIELGNDAMQSYADIQQALRTVIKKVKNPDFANPRPKIGNGSKIMDLNGNSVGTWEIEASNAQEL